jgi:glycine C-acetyltransferase
MAALGRHRPAPEPGGPVRDLHGRIARFVRMPQATTFASGAEAIRSTLAALLRPGDQVIVDAGSHPAMFETVAALGAGLHRSPPGSVEAVERRLRRLSQGRAGGRLFVAVPAVAAYTSVIADLAELIPVAARHGARLIVDVSHDLGTLGQDGRGVMELQGCLGLPDVVLGSLAKCFGAPGGFAALRDPDLARQPCSVPQAAPVSPVLAAALLAALDLIDSPEGRRRRRRLHGSALRLRNHLMADGLRVLGQPSPLVPVPLRPQTAFAKSDLLRSAGPEVPLLTPPLVGSHALRWRVLLSSDHSPADIDDLAELIRDVTRACDGSAHRRPRPVPLPQP